MKIFTNRKLCSKFIIVIVCVILLNFCFAPPVKAASFGGKMMGIMRDFATAIADVVATLVQFGVTGDWVYAVDNKGSGEPSDNEYWIGRSKFQYPILQVSPELIFANQIQLLDVNFISQVKDSNNYLLGLKDNNALKTLRDIIASWYVTLRFIAIIGLLSVLIYVGIRIIISSTSEKAKYKQMLMDWVIAFCLLFFMHYIMAATITVVEKVNDMLATNAGVIDGLPLNTEYGNVKYNITGVITPDREQEERITFDNADLAVRGVIKVNLAGTNNYLADLIIMNYAVKEDENKTSDKYSVTYRLDLDKCPEGTPECIIKLNYNIKEIDGKEYVTGGNVETTAGSICDITSANNYLKQLSGYSNNIIDTPIESNTANEENSVKGTITVESSNGKNIHVASESITDGSRILYFINYARLFLNVKDKDSYIPMSIAYLIIYIALVTFTAMFTIRYIKRVIYIAFLTLIAPMVALTYPLDKIKDRKSTSLEYVV